MTQIRKFYDHDADSIKVNQSWMNPPEDETTPHKGNLVELVIPDWIFKEFEFINEGLNTDITVLILQVLQDRASDFKYDRIHAEGKHDDIQPIAKEDFHPVGIDTPVEREELRVRQLPSRFTFGDRVHLDFYNAGYLLHGYVVNVKFSGPKVFYDVDVVVQASSKKETDIHTRLYNIDSAYVKEPEPQEIVFTETQLKKLQADVYELTGPSLVMGLFNDLRGVGANEVPFVMKDGNIG